MPDIKSETTKMSEDMNKHEIYGLVFGCPWLDEYENCIFKKLRNIDDLEEIINEVYRMPKEEQERLLKHHLYCNNMRCIDREKIIIEKFESQPKNN